MRAFLTLVAIAAVGLIAAALAGAKTKNESFTVGDANVIGPLYIRGDVAKVHARYSCDVGDHIWVSVKQNAAATSIRPFRRKARDSVARPLPGGRAIAAPSRAMASGMWRGSRSTRSNRAAAGS